MNDKKKNLEYVREKTADRLVEVMDLKHMTAPYLLQKGELYMSRQQFSQIKNKHRTLQRDDAIKISKVMKIDPGYLLGVDNFEAKSYNEFINNLKAKQEYQQDIQALQEYDYILNLIDGYKLVGASMHGSDSASTDYTYLGNDVSGKNADNIPIRRNGVVATIPADEMKRFESDVLDYIKIRFDALMMRYRDEDEEKRAKEDIYSYMHPGKRK